MPSSKSSEASKAAVDASKSSSLIVASNTQQVVSQLQRATAFDSPSILSTDAVPDDGTSGCKQILQYLSERGTSILRYPVDAQGRDLNPFRAGFAMASRSPLQLAAYLCVGAGHLSHIDVEYNKSALSHYTFAIHGLRKAINSNPEAPPAEWICAVAAILSFYELMAFHSAKSRLAHLIGFHRLTEARLDHQLPWSPLKILLEQYLHSLILNSFFHTELLVGQRSITHVDEVINIINEGGGRSGHEIVGVPEELTAAVYKLAILNNRDTGESPWDVELALLKSKLADWEPASHTALPFTSGLLLIARLYHFACVCLVQYLSDRMTGATNETTLTCLHEAHRILDDDQTRFQPFNSIVWPLTILSIFATNRSQRHTFRQPILMLARVGMIKGYESILSFLSLVEKEEIGPAVLSRPDLLDMVHM